MKNTKKRIENHQFYDFTSIERHLAQMAAKGWRLEKIGRMFWQYRRAPAKKLTYAVEYFEKGSDFHAGLPESQREFLEYCEASGWTLVTTWAQMMILVSEEEDPVPIETDPATRLEVIHRAMRKNFLPGVIAMLVLSVLELLITLPSLFTSPIRGWSSTGVSMGGTWGLLLFLYAARLVSYCRWRRRARRAVEAGEDLPATNARWIGLCDHVALVLILLILVWGYAGKESWMIEMIAVLLAAFFVNLFLTDRLRELLKRKGAGTMFNRVVTIGFCALFALATTGGTVWYVIAHADNRDPALTEYTYEVHDGWTRTVTLERDELPLRIEDMEPLESEAVSYESSISSTPFLTHGQYWQRCYDRPAHGSLDYEILDVHWSALYDLCLNEWLDDVNEDEVFDHHWEPVDAAVWNAERAYQVYWDEYGEFEAEYLVCWSDRIVKIDFDHTPTAEQLAAAATKLAP